MDATQLIQRGQDAYANGNYEAAEVYYNAVIDRFGADPKRYVEAKYEIGHLYMKLRKYDKAEVIFNEITGIFEESIPGSLPAAYKKLCEIEMDKVKIAKEKRAKILARKSKKTE